MSNVVSHFTVGTLPVDVLNIFNGGSWLRNKKIVAYGDSSGTTTNNFVEMLRDTYNLDITNRCLGGSTLSQLRPGVNPDFESNSGYQRITTAGDLNTFDYLFIVYTINDWQTYQQIYSNSYNDVYSYEYCVEQIIRTVNTTAPNCKIVFIFPWFCYRNNFDMGVVPPNGCTIDAYIDCAISICEKYSIDYINMYNIAGVNAQNYNTFLRNDSGVYVHANQNLAEIACNAVLMKNINTGYCHQNTWSNNLIDAYPGNLSVNPTEVMNLGGKIGTYPARKFSNVGNCTQLMSVSNDNNVLVRLSGYALQQVTVRFFTSKNGSISQTAPITITPGYFDMRLIVPNGDKLTPCFTGQEAGSLIWGLNFQVHGAPGAHGCSEYLQLYGGKLTWNGNNKYYYYSNGLIHIPGSSVTTKEICEAGTVLFGGFMADLPHTEMAFRNGTDFGMVAYIHNNCYTQTQIPSGRTLQLPSVDIPIDFYQG